MAAIKDWEREYFQISQLYAVKKAPMHDFHHQVGGPAINQIKQKISIIKQFLTFNLQGTRVFPEDQPF